MGRLTKKKPFTYNAMNAKKEIQTSRYQGARTQVANDILEIRQTMSLTSREKT